MTTQVIIYERPDPHQMQYLSLKPISLALAGNMETSTQKKVLDGPEETGNKDRRRKEKLIEKLKLHKVIMRPPTQKETALPSLVEQVNCSSELNALLQKNMGMITSRAKRALSVGERMSESANNLWDYFYIALGYFFRTWLRPVFAQVIIFCLMAHHVVAESILSLLHWRHRSFGSPALKDISATAQQIDLRLQQSCYWPVQYLTLLKRKANWESITDNHPDYIRFYNSIWLVANDVIMGFALGSFIIDNNAFVVAQVEIVFSTWAIEGLRNMISWLMGWPGGLKLNTELATFLGDLFLWVIDCWAGM